MVKHPVSKGLWRVVVIVAMILGMLPSQTSVVSARELADADNVNTAQPVDQPPAPDFTSLAPEPFSDAASDFTTTASASNSLTADLLPQFSSASASSTLVPAEFPPPGNESGAEVDAPEGALSLTPDAYLLAARDITQLTFLITSGTKGSHFGWLYCLFLPPKDM